MAFSRKHHLTMVTPDDPAYENKPSNWNEPHDVADAVSGGIPYFSSTTSEGTSALLAAGGVMIGGGAGAAPFTDAGLTYDSTTDKLTLAGDFAMGTSKTITGTTDIRVVVGGAGAGYRIAFEGQGTATNLVAYSNTTAIGKFDNQGVIQTPDGGYSFCASAATITSKDSGFTRIAAGLIGVGTGSGGSFAGRLKLTSTIVAGVAVAALNASPTTGEIQSVTDALTPVAGAAVAAGGAAKALVWYNGAQWTVIGV